MGGRTEAEGECEGHTMGDVSEGALGKAAWRPRKEEDLFALYIPYTTPHMQLTTKIHYIHKLSVSFLQAATSLSQEEGSQIPPLCLAKSGRIAVK